MAPGESQAYQEWGCGRGTSMNCGGGGRGGPGRDQRERQPGRASPANPPGLLMAEPTLEGLTRVQCASENSINYPVLFGKSSYFFSKFEDLNEREEEEPMGGGRAPGRLMRVCPRRLLALVWVEPESRLVAPGRPEDSLPFVVLADPPGAPVGGGGILGTAKGEFLHAPGEGQLPCLARPPAPQQHRGDILTYKPHRTHPPPTPRALLPQKRTWTLLLTRQCTHIYNRENYTARTPAQREPGRSRR